MVIEPLPRAAFSADEVELGAKVAAGLWSVAASLAVVLLMWSASPAVIS